MSASTRFTNLIVESTTGDPLDRPYQIGQAHDSGDMILNSPHRATSMFVLYQLGQ